ncbi:U-box domain-containing protein [Drosera capensis]
MADDANITTVRSNQQSEDDIKYEYISVNSHHTASSTSEIEEVDENPGQTLTPIVEESTIESSVFSYDINGFGHDRRNQGDDDEEVDAVYVVVEEKEGSQSSMDALLWALRDETAATTKVFYLIHVFPEIKFIPSPLGNGRVPKSQVRQDQVENYMVQEKGKRRQLLQKFIDKCIAHKVKAETILIESDDVAKVVSELLLVLNVRKLVVGVSKSNLRKLRSRKGNGVAVQILENAPYWCEIKCICEGKDALENQDMAAAAHDTLSPQHGNVSSMGRPKSPNPANNSISHQSENQQHRDGYLSYCCFKPNVANE